MYVTHFHSLVSTLSGRTVYGVGKVSSRRNVHVIGEMSCRPSVQHSLHSGFHLKSMKCGTEQKERHNCVQCNEFGINDGQTVILTIF